MTETTSIPTVAQLEAQQAALTAQQAELDRQMAAASLGSVQAAKAVLEKAQQCVGRVVILDRRRLCGNRGLAVRDVGLFTGDKDVAFVGFVESVKDRHQRRFARAVFPDDPMDRAGHNADRDVFIGLYRTKGLGNAFQLDRRSGSFLPLRMCCRAHA